MPMPEEAPVIQTTDPFTLAIDVVIRAVSGRKNDLESNRGSVKNDTQIENYIRIVKIVVAVLHPNNVPGKVKQGDYFQKNENKGVIPNGQNGYREDVQKFLFAPKGNIQIQPNQVVSEQKGVRRQITKFYSFNFHDANA
jgi:hypothetical protein